MITNDDWRTLTESLVMSAKSYSHREEMRRLLTAFRRKVEAACPACHGLGYDPASAGDKYLRPCPGCGRHPNHPQSYR